MHRYPAGATAPAVVVFGAMLLAVVTARPARAGSVTFTGGSGSLGAQVVFALSGSMLTVSLTNTSLVAIHDNPDVLTAVFWDSTTAMGGAFSAVGLGDSSAIVATPHGSIGSGLGSYGYGTAARNGDYVFSAAGFGLDYDGGVRSLAGAGGKVGGGDGGLAPAAGVDPSASHGLQGPLVSDTLVFTIAGVSPGFALADIDDVRFQYGTSLGGDADVPAFSVLPPSPRPDPAAVPAPAVAISGSALLAGWVLARALADRWSGDEG